MAVQLQLVVRLRRATVPVLPLARAASFSVDGLLLMLH